MIKAEGPRMKTCFRISILQYQTQYKFMAWNVRLGICFIYRLLSFSPTDEKRSKLIPKDSSLNLSWSKSLLFEGINLLLNKTSCWVGSRWKVSWILFEAVDCWGNGVWENVNLEMGWPKRFGLFWTWNCWGIACWNLVPMPSFCWK